MKKRLFLYGILFTATVLLLILSSLPLLLRTEPVRRNVENLIQHAISETLPVQIRIQRLGGNGYTHLTLGGIVVEDSHGLLFTAEEIGLSYSLGDIFQGKRALQRIRIQKPSLYLHRDVEKRWNILGLFRPDPEVLSKRTDPEIPFSVNRVQIMGGTAHVSMAREKEPLLIRVQFEATGLLQPDRLVLRRLELRTRNSEMTLQGSISSWESPEFNLQAQLQTPDLIRWQDTFGGLPPITDLTGAVQVEGSLDLAKVNFQLKANPGQEVRGTLRLRHEEHGATTTLWCEFKGLRPDTLEASLPGILNGAMEAEAGFPDSGGFRSRAAMKLHASEILGRELQEVSVHWIQEGDTLDEFEIEMDTAGGRAHLYASGTMGGVFSVGRPVLLQWSGSLQHGDPGIWLETPRLQGDLNADFSGSYEKEEGAPLSRGQIASQLLFEQGSFLGVSFESGIMELSGELERIRLEKARFLVDGGTIQFRGVGAVSGEFEASVDLDMETVSPWFAMWLGESVQGSIQGNLSAAGTSSSFDLKTSLTGRRMAWREFKADAMRLTYQGRITERQGSASIAFEGPSYGDHRLDGVHLELSGRPEKASYTLKADMDSQHGLVVTGHAENILSSVKELYFDRIELEQAAHRWTNEGAARVYLRPGEVSIREVALVSKGQALRLEGEYAFQGSGRILVRVEDVALDPFVAYSSIPVEQTGRITGEVEIMGSLEHPEIRLQFRTDRVVLSGCPLSDLIFEGTYRNGSADVYGRLRSDTGGEFVLEGRLPVRLSWPLQDSWFQAEEWNATIRGEGVNLSPLVSWIPGLTRIEGSLDIQAGLGGNLRKPQSRGKASITAPVIEVQGLPEPMRNVQIDLHWNEEWVKLRRCTLESREHSRVEITGELAHQHFKPKSFQSSFLVRDFPIHHENEWSATCDGRLEVGGDWLKPFVQGEVLVKDGIFFLDNYLDARKRDVIVVEDVVEETEDVRVSPWSDIFQETRMDVAIRISDKFRVRGTGTNIEFEGAIRVSKDHGMDFPKIEGPLTATRGWAAFQRKTFMISEGVIQFVGLAPPDPNLKIRGEYRVAGTSIFLDIGGTATRTTLELSSDPPLTQTDIISLLLFGTKASDLTRGQSVQLESSAFMFLGAEALRTLQEQLGHELPLDLLTVENSGPGGAGAVLVGKYLTPKLFIIYRKGVTSGDSDEVRMEYELHPRINLESRIGSEETGVDLFWSRDY